MTVVAATMDLVAGRGLDEVAVELPGLVEPVGGQVAEEHGREGLRMLGCG